MSDLHEQNRRAILDGLRELNARLDGLELRLAAGLKRIEAVGSELRDVRRQMIEQAAGRYGSGPTVG